MSNVYDALIKATTKNATIRPLSLSWQGISLERKITILVLGLLFLLILNQLMGRALRTQIDERSAIIATNLSDAAAGYIASKDVLQLKTIVTKYARLSGVAYALIEDREGNVIADSLSTFPPELQQVLASNNRRQVSRRELTLQNKPVYEIREPILDGQLGTAHIGIWADAVNREIDRVLFMFVWPITLGLLAGAIIVVISVRPLLRALRRVIDLRLGSAQAPSTHPSD
jgi:sensor histidine kinase regulating citrate/malate metabolism